MNLKVFCGILKETMIQIDAVESGEECLNLVEKNKYDMIFLDHMMPEMDGVETLHRMKELENSKCKDTPVIVLTANAISGAREFYLSEGFDDFMSKPFNTEMLERTILERLPDELIKYDEKIKSDNVYDNSDITSIESSGVLSSEYDNDILPDIEGIDWIYALSHFNNNIEMLLDMIKDFYNSMISEGNKLKNFYDELRDEANKEIITRDIKESLSILEGNEKIQNGLKQYRIQIHSMKSSANLIGAKDLGESAKKLEEAANQYNLTLIINLTGDFLEKWEMYRKRLEIISVDNGEKKELDREVVLECLESLKKAFEDMDIDKMDEIMKDINEFAFPNYILDDIQSLKAVVTDLDEDKGIPLIETLINRINRE